MAENATSKGTSQRHDARVLGILRTTGSGVGRVELRIVAWNERLTVLENRQWVLDRENGGERPGKNRGLMLSDLEFILANFDKVKALMVAANEGKS